MNEDQQNSQQDAIDVRQLARAIRFALVAIVLGLSYLSIRSSLSIGSVGPIFAAMHGGRPLPALTRFVLGAGPLFVAVSVLVPIVAIATLFLRSVVGSFYVIGVLSFVTIAQFISVYHGLSEPLSRIIIGLSSGPTP